MEDPLANAVSVSAVPEPLSVRSKAVESSRIYQLRTRGGVRVVKKGALKARKARKRKSDEL